MVCSTFDLEFADAGLDVIDLAWVCYGFEMVCCSSVCNLLIRAWMLLIWLGFFMVLKWWFVVSIWIS